MLPVLRLRDNGQALNPVYSLPGSKKTLQPFFHVQYQVQGLKRKLRPGFKRKILN